MLEKYRDFTERHQVNGQYSWESGLEGLLSVLTPDPKAVVLYSMPREKPFFGATELGRNVLDFIENLGMTRRFPVGLSSIWSYCYNPELTHNEGSLVSIGAVVKEANYHTPAEDKTAYYVSEAGHDLAKPLMVSAAEWVQWARNSGLDHKYDSMWRVLGGVHSKTERRRPLALYSLVDYLVTNPGYHRAQDLIDAFVDKVASKTVSTILNSQGLTGVIDYQSPTRDIGGKRPKGYATYELKQPMSYQQILDKIRQSLSSFRNTGYLKAILNYIETNPDDTYVNYELAQKLRINSSQISHLLTILQRIGILSYESGFTTHRQSRARANDLTRSFYDMIVLPARETAQTLTPLHSRVLTPDLTNEFLANYQEERSNIGLKGGEEVRDIILQLFSEQEQMKLSHLIEEGNNRMDREVSGKAWGVQVQQLIKRREVTKLGRGIYKKR